MQKRTNKEYVDLEILADQLIHDLEYFSPENHREIALMHLGRAFKLGDEYGWWEEQDKKMVEKDKDIVQIKEPKSGHYVKIDRTIGTILCQKSSKGPYKNIPIARRHK